MLFLSLFAQANRPAGSPFDRPDVIWGTAGLAGALFVGALVVFFVDRWRKHQTMTDREAGAELTSFRALYERGEITEEEYNRLRQKVAARVKKSPAAQAPAPVSDAGAAAPPAASGPFPPGYFDDPPNGAAPPSNPAGGRPPPA